MKLPKWFLKGPSLLSVVWLWNPETITRPCFSHSEKPELVSKENKLAFTRTISRSPAGQSKGRDQTPTLLARLVVYPFSLFCWSCWGEGVGGASSDPDFLNRLSTSLWSKSFPAVTTVLNRGELNGAVLLCVLERSKPWDYQQELSGLYYGLFVQQKVSFKQIAFLPSGWAAL